MSRLGSAYQWTAVFRRKTWKGMKYVEFLKDFPRVRTGLAPGVSVVKTFGILVIE